MDIRNMRQVLAVRRYGSFAKAAEALGMSQPSLSAAIARLEDQLKVRLFDRTSAGSRLTPIGELIAERAGKVVAEAEQIVHEAALVAGGEAGAVRLGIGTALRHAFLPRFLVTLAENHPALGVSIDVLDRDRLLPLLKARKLDLIICAMSDDVGAEELVVTEVLTAPAFAVAHPRHPLIGERKVSVDRFAGFPGGGPGLKGFTAAELLKPAEDQGAVGRYQSNDFEVLLQLATAGHMTLIAPAFVVQDHLRDGRLKRIDLDWTFKVTYAAIAARATSFSPIVRRIVGHAVALGAALQAEAGAEVGIPS